MMRFYSYSRQNKDLAFISALLKRGAIRMRNPEAAQVILTDVDLPARINKFIPEIEEGKKLIFVYPHSAIPNVFWDGIAAPSDKVSIAFVPAPGHRAILEKIGYPCRIEEVGWGLSEIREFVPRNKIRNVLFAPIHPNQSTFLSAEDKGTNAKTFTRLLDFAKRDSRVTVTVRVNGTLKNNGIWHDPRVTYIQSEMDANKAGSAILKADVVIGKYTFAYISVAMGAPTVMMGEDITPKSGKDEGSLTKVSSWESYKSIMKFPLDALDESRSMEEILSLAGNGDYDIIRDWKARMIGKPFSGTRFADHIFSYYKELL